MNGKPGKLAVIIKGSFPRSENIGKIVLLKYLASEQEIKESHISLRYNNIWVIDTPIQYYNIFLEKTHKGYLIPDESIRLLPDLDEDDEVFEENSLFLPEEQV